MSAQAASRRVPTVTQSCVACGGTGGQNQNVPVPAYVKMDALALPGSPWCCTPVSSTVVTRKAWCSPFAPMRPQPPSPSR